MKLKSLYDISYAELSSFQRKIMMPLKILLAQKKIYHKKIKADYDIEIAFLEGPITRILSTKNRNTKKIVWVHNDISLVFGKGIKAKLKKKIDAKIYQKYEKIIFVSKDNQKKFEKIYNNLKPIDKRVIYNYINKQSILQKAKETADINFNKNVMNFVSVARLVPQKAIDRLIEVHSRLIEEGLSHNFYVVGEGPEKEKLQEMITNKKVEDTFHLLGKKENPYPYIKAGDYFCLLSHFEGYGMVLEEAKILDKPIIITDTAGREAVEGYKNVVLLENDEKAIYEGLKNIIENENKQDTQEKEEYDNKIIIEKLKELLG